MSAATIVFLSAVGITALAAGLRLGRRRAGGARARRETIAADEQDAHDRILTNLAHELRTPLTALIGFADIASQSALDEARRRDALARIRASGHRLLQVVNDLRDYGRLLRGELRVHHVDAEPRTVVRRLETLTRQAAERKGLLFAIHVDDAVPGRARFDPDRTAQVLLALLDNAIRFTRRGHVALTVTCTGEQLCFEVHDTGPGMAERERRVWSTRPGQGDASHARRHGGVGLGLKLAVGIIERLGGGMQVDSHPGEGTAVRVRLPYAASRLSDALLTPRQPAARHSGSRRRGPPARSTARPRVHARALVVTADAGARMLVGHALECVGMDVTEIAPEAWLERAGRDTCDVVLVDIHERDAAALHQVAALQARSPRHHPPVVGLMPRAVARGALPDRALAQGCAATLAMPLDRDTLATTLFELVRGRGGDPRTALGTSLAATRPGHA